MRKITLPLCAIVGAMLPVLLASGPAQATIRWVSGTGTGTTGTGCLRTNPCPTFQTAHDATSAGSEIHCVDDGEYGALTITKAISIVCDIGSIQVNAITIAAGPADIITLNGLDLDGAAVTSPGGAGIVFSSGAALHLNKVKVRNYRTSSGDAGGIYFQPNAYAELYISDSIVSDNGGPGSFSGGIIITPGSSASVNAFLSRVKVENNSTGILVDGTRSTGLAVNATVLDTLVTGSAADGILAQSSAGKAAASVFVDHSVASGNFGSGVRASGTAASGAGSAFARIGDSTIVLNATGVSIGGAGVLQSYKNNRISGNLTDGTPIPPFPGPGGSALQ